MLKTKKRVRVLGTVWSHWKPSFKKNGWFLFVTFLVYSLGMCIDYMYKPVQWKNIFDALVTGSTPWHYFSTIVIASIIGWALARIGETCIVFAEASILKELKDYCIKGLLGKNTQFFHTHPSGALIAKWKRFASVSETVIDEVIFSISRSVLLMVYVLIYAYFLIPDLAFPFFLFILVFTLATVWLSKIRMEYDLKSSELDSRTTARASDIISSVFTLRTFTAIPQTTKEFAQVTYEDKKKRQHAWFIGNIQWSVQGLCILVLEVYCMYHALQKVEQGVYTLGTVAMIQSYIASLGAYMWGLGRSLIKVRTAFADAYEMGQLLHEPNEEPLDFSDEIQNTNKESLCGGIVCENVSFSYNENSHKQTLKNFSFFFEEGKQYGIIGKTGAGKSTLTKLLLRAYPHTQGTITVCNKPIESLHKMELRSYISYVPQDPQFPSTSIRNILKLGNPEATDEELELIARQASCDFIWEKLPSGFDTEVGERGIRLSGGERQRIAIATALLKDAPIVIMDEPTSALDAQTEKTIQDAIQTLFKGKTLIVIAHRLSTVAPLDEILLLKDGELEVHAPHEELLEISAEYTELWKLQTTKH